MTDFKALIALLQSTVDNFQQVIPGIQDALLDRLREELSALKLNGKTIAISTANVKKIAEIKSKLLGIVLSDEYKAAVKDYVAAFTEINRLQNSYFNTIAKKYSPPKVTAAIQKQAVLSVLEQLTERGIETNVLGGIEDILRKNITTGGSYAEMQRALENNITNNTAGEGTLSKYTKQMTTDALNQYSAQYSQIVSSDLGLDWFVYAGSNLETTRPFCLACTKKRYIHRSEFPALLRGDFPEFEAFDGKLYKGLPAGMIPDTTPANLPINRGGYQCGHQLRPVSESAVPADVRALITV